MVSPDISIFFASVPNIIVLGYLTFKSKEKFLLLGGFVALSSLWIFSGYYISTTSPFLKVNAGWIIILPMLIILNLTKKWDFFLISWIRIIPNALWGIGIGIFFAVLVILSSPSGSNGFMDNNIVLGIFSRTIWISVREELYFRGFVLSNLEKIGTKSVIAVAIQGVLFSVGHLWKDPIGFLISTLFGFSVGILALKHKNMSGGFIAHILINFLPDIYQLM